MFPKKESESIVLVPVCGTIMMIIDPVVQDFGKPIHTTLQSFQVAAESDILIHVIQPYLSYKTKR